MTGSESRGPELPDAARWGSWTSKGFPERSLHRGLTISGPARCLIASIANVDDDHQLLRLFSRGFGERVYREIAHPEECNAFEPPLASPVEPVLYAIGMHWQAGGGNCVGVFRIRLPERTTELAFPGSRVGASAVRRERWISRLHGFAADGRRLFVTLAHTVPLGGEDLHVGYSVCIWDPDTGAVDHAASLLDPFA